MSRLAAATTSRHRPNEGIRPPVGLPLSRRSVVRKPPAPPRRPAGVRRLDRRLSADLADRSPSDKKRTIELDRPASCSPTRAPRWPGATWCSAEATGAPGYATVKLAWVSDQQPDLLDDQAGVSGRQSSVVKDEQVEVARTSGGSGSVTKSCGATCASPPTSPAGQECVPGGPGRPSRPGAEVRTSRLPPGPAR